MLKEKDLEFANECVKVYEGLTDEEKAQTWVGMRNITQNWLAGKVAQKGVCTLLIGGLAVVVISKIASKHSERKAKRNSQVEVL